MLRDDAIYVAGFFDGEGCIGIYTNGRNKSHHLRVQLTQNESPEAFILLDNLCKEFGGSISRSKTPSGKFKLNWQVSSDKAVKFLAEIAPYLRGKATQATLAIAWQDARATLSLEERKQVAQAMKELKT